MALQTNPIKISTNRQPNAAQDAATEGFVEALKNREMKGQFDSATLSPANGKSILFLAWPITHHGKFVGHLGGTIQLAKLTEKITDKIKFGISGYPFIIDQDGRVAQEISSILKQSIEKSVSVTSNNEKNVAKGAELLEHLRKIVKQIAETASQVRRNR